MTTPQTPRLAGDDDTRSGGVTTLPAVMGFDLSAESTGIALPDGRTFTIKAPKAAGKRRTLTDDLKRLNHIGAELGLVLAFQPADLVVIEDYAPGIRSSAAHRLAEVGGVVRLACHRASVPIALVNPTHLKIYATGNSRADKGDMRISALKRAGIEFPNDDECDAWWLRAMGLDHLDLPPVDLPKINRAALDKVAWPHTPELETP